MQPLFLCRTLLTNRKRRKPPLSVLSDRQTTKTRQSAKQGTPEQSRTTSRHSTATGRASGKGITRSIALLPRDQTPSNAKGSDTSKSAAAFPA